MYFLSAANTYLHRIKSFYYKRLALLRIGSHGQQLYIHGKCNLSKNTFLGNNVNMNGIDIIGSGNVYIGNNFHSGAGCLLITSNHNYDYGTKIPYDETSIAKNIIIDDNVWLGSRVIILGGIHIHEGAIIQAGAVVVSDIPSGGIAGGNPAKVFKNRNMEHYQKLKMAGQCF